MPLTMNFYAYPGATVIYTITSVYFLLCMLAFGALQAVTEWTKYKIIKASHNGSIRDPTVAEDLSGKVPSTSFLLSVMLGSKQ